MLGYRDNTIVQVRSQFADMLLRDQFVGDKTGSRMLEIQGASFLADEDAIFGTVNLEYTEKEIKWYESRSLNVNDIPGGPPKQWVNVADVDGFINSNYGWAIDSLDNGYQYVNAFNELKKNPESRRAVMIYTRPSMWTDYNKNGRSDFMCTNTVQYLIRDGYLDVIVQMRSNDVFWGYRNDYHWQKYVQSQMLDDLRELWPDLERGQIYWQVGSLHVYEKDFFLVDYYEKTGIHAVTKKAYTEKYPNSQWATKSE